MGIPEVAGAIAGNGLAGYLQSKFGGKESNINDMFQTPDFVKNINNILQQARDQAINSSTGYTNQAIQKQSQALNAGNAALQTGLTGATNAATSNVNQGLQTYQNLQRPYASQGYAAMDALSDSLGLSRVGAGSEALVNSLQAAQQYQNLNNLFGGQAPTNPGAAPVYNGPAKPTGVDQYLGSITPQQISRYIEQNSKSGQSLGLNATNMKDAYGKTGNKGDAQTIFRAGKGDGSPVSLAYSMNDLINDQRLRQYAQRQLAQHEYNGYLNQYNAAQKAYSGNLANYNNQLNTYNQYGNQLQQSGISPQQLAMANAYNKGLFTR